MGLKTYLKFKPQDTFGVINSPGIDFIPLPSSDGRVLIAASGEDVSFWNIRQGVLLDVFRDPENKSLVSTMTLDPQGQNLAVGYNNGLIRIWNIAKKEITTVFNGHNIAVTCLKYDPNGHMLVSGSKDTEIVLWDVVSEQGLYRLKGHKDEITDLNWLTIQTQIPQQGVDNEFIQQYIDSYQVLPAQYVEKATKLTLLITSSKDTTIKFWDLTIQHCLHTISSQSGEVWSFDILHHDPYSTTTNMALTAANNNNNNNENQPSSQNKQSLVSSAVLVAGSTDKFLRCWRLRTNLIAPSNQSEQTVLDSLFEHSGIHFSGVVERIGAHKRVNRVRFLSSAFTQQHTDPTTTISVDSASSNDLLIANPSHDSTTATPQTTNILTVYGIDKAIDIYRVRPLDDKKQRQRRRFKRYKDKLQDIQQRVNEKKLPTSAYSDAERDIPPMYLPSDDLETCVPFRLDERMTNFCYLISKSMPSIDFNKTALAASDIKKSSSLTTYKLPTEYLSLTTYCGFADNTIQLCQFNLTPLTKLQNESLRSDSGLSPESHGTIKVKHNLNTPGHRSPVRSLQLSSDDSLLMSVGGNDIKFWNMKTHSCLRTISLFPLYNEDSGEQINDSILSALFVPGNKHVAVGTKQGYLDLYEIASGLLLNREEGEVGQPIWALDLAPDGRSFASTCGKQVWFWELEMVDVTDEEMAYFSTMSNGSTAIRQKKLTFSQTRALQLTDDVLCLKHSPDGRYIAVGLLDSTVRLFHTDSLNFFLSLYGHKLPVLTLDISDDSTVIVTGSNDKTVKIWGMDFGDLKRSLHAHDNSVMKVKFQPRTHFFFSVGKDFGVKYWDADRFIKIHILIPHQSEVLSLTTTYNGRYIITASNDKAIKRYFQSDEALIPSEEDENELIEEMVDSATESFITGTASTLQTSQRIGQITGSGFGSVLSESEEVWAKSLRTKDAVGITEYVLDSLEHVRNEHKNWDTYHELVRKTRRDRREQYLATVKLRHKIKHGQDTLGAKELSKLSTIQLLKYQQDSAKIRSQLKDPIVDEEPLDASDIPQPPPNPIFMGKTPSQYILSIISVIKPTQLHTILISLPFDYAILLIKLLSVMLKQGTGVELCTKTILFVLKIHQTQLITTMNRTYIELLGSSRDNMRLRLDATRQLIGTNIAGFQFLTRYLQDLESKTNAQGQSKSLHKIAEEEIDKLLGRDSKTGKQKENKKYSTRAHKRQRTGIRRLKNFHA